MIGFGCRSLLSLEIKASDTGHAVGGFYFISANEIAYTLPIYIVSTPKIEFFDFFYLDQSESASTDL